MNKSLLLNSLNSWWGFLKPRHRNDFVEIRLIPSKNLVKGSEEYFRFWRELNDVHSIVFNKYGTIRNKSASFFVKTLEEVKLLLFSSDFVFFNSKPCYGLNPRQRNDKGELNGTMDCVGFYDVVGIDIDNFDLLNNDNTDKFNDLLLLLEKYHLFKPLIVSSGGGVHLIYRIKRQRVTESKKLWFKSFFEEISVKAELLGVNKLDVLHDSTRVFSIPGSFNVKRKKFVLVHTPSGFVNESFRVRFKKVLKSDVNFNSVGFVGGLGGVEDSLEFMILSKGEEVPKGERNSVLVFFLKMLIRDLGEDYRKVERVLKNVFSDINLNPKNGIDGKNYNKKGVLNWCNRNWKWVCKQPDLVEKVLVYGGKKY